MTLTQEEFNHISKPPLRYNDKIWTKAFELYNRDHPNDRPLNTNCIPCYVKVFRYIKSIRDEEDR